ncbi:hypothetical protein V8G54_008059, partial [Vigna mungo]
KEKKKEKKGRKKKRKKKKEKEKKRKRKLIREKKKKDKKLKKKKVRADSIWRGAESTPKGNHSNKLHPYLITHNRKQTHYTRSHPRDISSGFQIPPSLKNRNDFFSPLQDNKKPFSITSNTR